MGNRIMGTLRPINIGNERFEVLDPKQILLHVIRHRSFASTWLIKDFLFIGGQGTGKSTFINYLLELITAINSYRRHGILIVRTNDVRILSDKRYNELFKGVKIIILILDDIMSKGFDSRRSMSSANVGMTQFYNKSRHALREKWEASPNEHSRNGILFVFFANQVKSRVDATIRENVMVKIFTSYVDRAWFRSEFRGAKQLKQMDILRRATFEGDLGDQYTSKSVNIIKLKTGELSACRIPRYYVDSEGGKAEYSDDTQILNVITRRDNVNHVELFRDLGRNDFIELLREKLTNKFRSIENMDRGIMMAYLQDEADKLNEEYAVNYTKGDLVRVIDSARMREFECKDRDRNKWKDAEIIALHDTFGLSFRKIAVQTGMSHSTAHKRYIRGRKRLAEKLEAQQVAG